jgi:hypothetical protein
MSYTQVHTCIHTYIRTYILVHTLIHSFTLFSVYLYTGRIPWMWKLSYIHTHTHIYINTYIHTRYIKTFHGSISLSQESRMWNESYTYIKIFTTFRCILTRYFYMSSAHIKNTSTEQNECVFSYLFSAILKFDYLFLRFVSLRGKLLNILIPEYVSGMKNSRPRP